MTRPPLHSIQEIVARLTAAAENLAVELLPGGKREGREWVAGDLHGSSGRGVSVCIGGSKVGRWADFQGGGGSGDLLDLVAATRTGGDKGEALKWARAWLGLSGERVREVAPPPPRPRQDPQHVAARRHKIALKIFGVEAQPWPGTPVEHYLHGRGIRRADLVHVPNALRFNPECLCPERNRAAPAMVACIMRGSEMIGVHRTWIEPAGSGAAARGANIGAWKKAPLRSAKKVLGEQRGGYIPLARGASGQPLARAPAGDVVALCEGIEDGLTIATEMPDWRVLAAINVGNLGNLDLPASIGTVVLCLDRDGENQSSAAAIEAAVQRYTNEGRDVREARPPEGFKDFNDWRQAVLAGGERKQTA
jgi:hypothetical protein